MKKQKRYMSRAETVELAQAIVKLRGIGYMFRDIARMTGLKSRQRATQLYNYGLAQSQARNQLRGLSWKAQNVLNGIGLTNRGLVLASLKSGVLGNRNIAVRGMGESVRREISVWAGLP